MLGPLLAMPSGQGLNMTLLAILISIASIAVDVKAWTCFFLEDGGMHSKKLHPQPGMNLSYWAVKWDMFETVWHSLDIHFTGYMLPRSSKYKYIYIILYKYISIICIIPLSFVPLIYLFKCRSARWFTANQLKPRSGFRATVLQIGFMMVLWFVRSSVSVELEQNWKKYDCQFSFADFWNSLESNILLTTTEEDLMAHNV